MGRLMLTVVASLVVAVAVHAVVEMNTDLRLVHGMSQPIAVFRCTTGQDQLFYLRHMLTWSKIGTDGREHYLSINWNVLPEARTAGYEVASQVYYENSTTHPAGTYNLYFVLSRGALSQDDQGRYICRLHDMDRNLIAESSVPIVVYENNLAMYPYKVESQVGKPASVHCLYNATNQPTAEHVSVSHVSQDGTITKIATNGRLENEALAGKYAVMSSDVMGSKNLTVVLKSPVVQDSGLFLCEVTGDNVTNSTTKVKIIVGRPKLHVVPKFFLQMPVDSRATFECSCDVSNTDACVTHTMAWSMRDGQSAGRKYIYRDGQLTEPELYSISKAQNGTSLILNISALSINKTEGDYICSLHHSTTGEEITSVSVPTSVHPISINALMMMDQFPSVIRFLCLVGGTHWNTHYLETHRLQWRHIADNGTSHVMAENGNLGNGLDARKYRVLFDATRGYSVLDVESITDKDHGKYQCLLLSNANGSILKEKTLSMQGLNNSTTVAPSQ